MDWNFLLNTLHAFGFNDKFVNWISTILQSDKLSINVNGENVGFFSCKRGVRQGDPLSSLLFCIVEDVLSRGISKLVLEGKLSTINCPCNLKTCTHALYAYDILIFYKGIKRELIALKHLLIDYGVASGQLTNPVKCKFFSGKISARKVASLSDSLGFSASSIPFNYLGVHIFKLKPRKIHIQPIADKIMGNLATWKGHSLSIMGRMELVRSVIQNTSIRNFIWSGDTKIRKLVTVAWKKIPESIQPLLKAKVTDFINESKWFIPSSLANRLAIALSGNQTQLNANTSLQDFNILRSLNIAINYSKAPKIVEVCWNPPLHDRIKINSDGAVMCSPGNAAGGALFRNHRGEFLRVFADFFGIHDALYAELNSAIMAINFAHKKGWLSVWLKSDSALVVEIFKGKTMVPWKLINKWNHCKALLSSMDCIVSHVYREGNSCADKLAIYGLHHKIFSLWNFVPNFLLEDFSRNRMGLPNYRFTSL
ncbi:PREDICTED: uncharacterized protein LOC109338757 [Lupinus angustifolius]|uniref:uncharacterized protein LOC109338757 n=1 Tax=Lupinus angustifolius TaxID=3871 RepID=UPI00092F661C|nr:PREDICTED: uncharacterized protein LOC109338757 [Lupinus angustifolius]